MANDEEEILEESMSSLSIGEPPPSPPWVELPREITANILQRLGALEILTSAQNVCATWWKVCHDGPAMWQVVDMKKDGICIKKDVLTNICRIAVDRSQGQLLKLSIENFGNKDLLNYIAGRSGQLKQLRLVSCGDLAGGLAAAAKNFPLLEELHISFTFITEDDIEIAGRSCPLLNTFILSTTGYDNLRESQYDDQALAIARSMPELRHLVLIDSSLSNGALQAILDGCSHLELFDLRCSCCDDGRRRGQPIVDLKQPRDSTHDYEIDSQDWWRYCHSDDYNFEYDFYY